MSVADESTEVLRRSRVGLLTTYRRNGEPVATPVSIAVRAGAVYFVTPATSGKARRLTAGAGVTLAPAAVRGTVTGPATHGQARLLNQAERKRVRRLVQPGGPLFWSYLLYRILKAGYTIVYEPTAVVWHHHRRDGSALQRQLFGYYKGAVAHQLATLQRDRDLRAARHLAVELPRWYGQQLRAIARGSSNKPLQVWLTQLRGFVAGPSAYVRSRARVRRWGTSREPRA